MKHVPTTEAKHVSKRCLTISALRHFFFWHHKVGINWIFYNHVHILKDGDGFDTSPHVS